VFIKPWVLILIGFWILIVQYSDVKAGFILLGQDVSFVWQAMGER